MNEIEKLIHELCPDGVEFRKLRDLLDYEQPGKYIVKTTDYSPNYNIPVLTAGQSFILGYTNETEGIFEATKQHPVIIFDDFTTSFHWVDFSFKVKSSAMKMLRLKSDAPILLRFIYYCMQGIVYETLEHSRQWISKYSKFEIPVPPMAVQRKIVEILDNFTLLEAELEAELEARRKQYEYYREKLLTFNTPPNSGNVRWCALGEVATMKAGIHINASRISETISAEKSYPCYGGNGLRGFVSEYNQEVETLLIGRQGALCGNIKYVKGKLYATEHAVVTKPKLNICDISYLYHLLINYDLNQYKSAGAQPGLAVSKIQAIKIPLPPLSEQRRIADILDKFEVLTTSLQDGLPAEIAARRKQYEYYRNKLLTFNRKTA